MFIPFDVEVVGIADRYTRPGHSTPLWSAPDCPSLFHGVRVLCGLASVQSGTSTHETVSLSSDLSWEEANISHILE